MQLQKYLELYAESHRHPLNVKIHNVCVPFIAWTALGMAHSFSYQGFHLSYFWAVFLTVFYARFRDPRIILGSTVTIAAFLLSYAYVPNLFVVCLAVFLLCWVGQFYGHHVEGKKPSFRDDLVFLLIGPIWVVKKLAGASS